MIINCGAHSCYNYYLDDCSYLWFYLSPLPASKVPANAVLFEYNIEHIIFKIVQTVINTTNSNKKGYPNNERVLIHSANSLFSDENVAVSIGYLIVRYLYTFEKAFEVLSRNYAEYKQSKDAKL